MTANVWAARLGMADYADAFQASARVNRLWALDDALQAVLTRDRAVMTASEADALNAAQAALDSLRRTW